ncbi:MAG: ASCH domain-containing protein [Elusimicrobia bacterium]|nr:ASCH domain-containing protein [Elusimicrobiota bacterium]
MVKAQNAKKFKFGWYGDGGLGEKLIEAIASGRKTATSCPAYDPEDAGLKVGDKLDLTDKHGKVRANLVVTNIELRPFGSFDDKLAAREGTTLEELKRSTSFANGREIRPEEEMRVIYFELVQSKIRI